MSQSRLIRSILSSALQLWLRSLVTQAKGLAIAIDAGDRQLLGGRIPSVSLRADQVIYQGLHVLQLALQASGIRINLGQVLRGKPVQLAEPVLAQMQAHVSATDLNRSLQSELLSTALAQVTQQLLPERHAFQVQHIDLGPGQITLQGQWIDDDRSSGAAQLTARLTAQGSAIQVRAVEIRAKSSEHSSSTDSSLRSKASPKTLSLPDRSFALGDATLQQLTITADAITVEAQITILP
ncbi:MAG: DUF2993 domain-containing protein [Elainellaceae cyanobacterium]